MKFEVVKCTAVLYWEEVCSFTDTAYQKVSEIKLGSGMTINNFYSMLLTCV